MAGVAREIVLERTTRDPVRPRSTSEGEPLDAGDLSAVAEALRARETQVERESDGLVRAADQGVVVGRTPVDHVRALADEAVQLVVARPALHRVLAFQAGQELVAEPAHRQVLAELAFDGTRLAEVEGRLLEPRSAWPRWATRE